MEIYKITNLVNGKKYVGQTIGSFKRRWNEHCCNRKSKKFKSAILNAILKYGKENFKIELICFCTTINELNEKEQFYIKELNTLHPNGYNLAPGGNNHIPTEETKKKISDANKGNKYNLGRKLSEETKRKISEANKGKKRKPFSEEARKNISAAAKGRLSPKKGTRISEETREKISKSLKGKPSGNKGKKASEETRRKMSEARKGEKNSFYNKKHTNEAKQKMKEAALKRKISKAHKHKKCLNNTISICMAKTNVCPECLTKDCYIGFNVVECWNVDCRHYTKKQHEIQKFAEDTEKCYNRNNFYGPDSISALLEEYIDNP